MGAVWCGRLVGRLFDLAIGDVIGPVQAELAACPQGALFELGREASLLADFVSRDSVKLPVAFDRNDLDVIGVNGMVAAFPEEMEAVFFQIASEITSLDRHAEPLQAVAR